MYWKSVCIYAYIYTHIHTKTYIHACIFTHTHSDLLDFLLLYALPMRPTFPLGGVRALVWPHSRTYGMAGHT